ncbi:MAG: hypothetical protein ABUL72_03295, partial [Armatimonadota bacterium]
MRNFFVLILLLLSSLVLAGKRQAPILPVSLIVETNPAVGGNNIVGKVTLNHFAPIGGQQVQLSSDITIPDLPITVTVPYGKESMRFSFTPNGVDSRLTFQLHATANSTTVNTSLTVDPAKPTLFYFEPANVIGGNNTSGVVNLDGKAGPSGMLLTLTSHSSRVVMPATVTVPAGGKRAVFAVQTGPVDQQTVASPTAVAPDGKTAHGTLTLLKAVMLRLELNKTSVAPGGNFLLTARLDGVAPVG